MEIAIQTITPFRVAGLEHRGPYNTISQTWQQFGPAVATANLLTPGAHICSIYCCPGPDPVPESELVSYAAVEIAPGVTPPAPWVVYELSGGDYARVIYTGPYASLGQVWDAFSAASMLATGRMLRLDDSFEVYLNDPGTTHPEQLQTALYLPLGIPVPPFELEALRAKAGWTPAH